MCAKLPNGCSAIRTELSVSGVTGKRLRAGCDGAARAFRAVEKRGRGAPLAGQSPSGSGHPPRRLL